MERDSADKWFEGHLVEHQGILSKICRVYGVTGEDREDLAQEILIALWKSRGSYNSRRAFSTWMYRVALNTAISWLRHDSTRRRHLAPVSEQALATLPSCDPISDETSVLYTLIAALDPLHKALMLLYLDGCSHQEIADVLGISTSNVSTKIHRLTSRWKQQLDPGQTGGSEDMR